MYLDKITLWGAKGNRSSKTKELGWKTLKAITSSREYSPCFIFFSYREVTGQKQLPPGPQQSGYLIMVKKVFIHKRLEFFILKRVLYDWHKLRLLGIPIKRTIQNCECLEPGGLLPIYEKLEQVQWYHFQNAHRLLSTQYTTSKSNRS